MSYVIGGCELVKILADKRCWQGVEGMTAAGRESKPGLMFAHSVHAMKDTERIMRMSSPVPILVIELDLGAPPARLRSLKVF